MRLPFLLALVTLSAGCTEASFDLGVVDPDGGAADTTAGDTSTDSRPTDGSPDTGVGDSGSLDSGLRDSALDKAVLDTGILDTGVLDTGVPDTSVLDTGVPDTSVLDTGPETPTCVGAISDSSTDVYVNAAAAPGGNGTTSCPFRTIVPAANAAIGAGVLRTIHVAAGTYAEIDTVRLKSGVTLKGEGGTVTVKGTTYFGGCLSTGEKCTISMEAGATVDTVLVDASSAPFGIVGPGAATGTAPSVLNTTVTSALQDGGIFLGGATVKSSHFDKNTHAGLVVRGGTLTVSGTSSFDSNLGSSVGGIVVAGLGTLNFQGGTANTNAGHGIVFDLSIATTTTGDTINGLTAKGNGTYGLGVLSGNRTYIVVHNSIFSGNLVNVFLQFNASSTNIYEFGTSSPAGNNTFAAEAKTRALMVLCNSGYGKSTAALGNAWGSCPPGQKAVTSCDPPASYVDIAYKGVAADPVDTTACK